jgi:hypothetical protein
MMPQVLRPGVQHSEHADASAQMARVGGDLQQGLGSGSKQQVVEQRWFLSASGASCSGTVKTTWA